MKLIITRHGYTEENEAGIFQGHLPGKLTEEGIEQAKKLALRLKDEHIDYIYSSDLARGADTAKEIAKFHPNTPIEFTTELRERNLGEFQGKKKSDLGFDNKSFKVTHIQPKNGETMEQLFDRAKAFLDKIIPKHKDGTVVLVGHNGINKSLMAVIMGKDYTGIDDIENQHNTGVNIFEIDEDRNHKIHILNDVSHL